MKQTWSFQRWRRRYFKLKGNKLYYAKDTKVSIGCRLVSVEINYQKNLAYKQVVERVSFFYVLWQKTTPVSIAGHIFALYVPIPVFP